MKSNDEYLYIFLHVPKTGGSSITRNMLYNLPTEAIRMISHGSEGMFHDRREVDDYISAIPKRRRDELRIIFGHSVYYGIHEHFDREPRYVTFLRDPLSRTVSNYNHFMKHYDLFVEQDGAAFPLRKEDFAFFDWWNHFQRNMQLGLVLNFRVDGKPGWDDTLELSDRHLEEGKRLLDKFYFVGLSDTFEEDSHFLYHELGFSELLKQRQNVTKRHYITLNDDLKEVIEPGLAPDIGLFEHAVELNRAFKAERPKFSQVAERTRSQARLVTSARFLILDTAEALLGQRRLIKVYGGATRALLKMRRLVRPRPGRSSDGRP